MTGRIIERSHEGYTFRYWESDKGTVYSNFDCERRLEAAVWAVSRWFARCVRTRTTHPDPAEDRDDLQMRAVRWKIEKLAEHAQMMLTQLDELEGVDRKRERVKALRRVAGRTPAEAAAYLAKAAQLEGDAT